MLSAEEILLLISLNFFNHNKPNYLSRVKVYEPGILRLSITSPLLSILVLGCTKFASPSSGWATVAGGLLGSMGSSQRT